MRILLGLALILSAARAVAQQGDDSSTPATPPESTRPAPGSSEGQSGTPPAQHVTSGPPSGAKQSGSRPARAAVPGSKQQSKRILGVMSNYRAVSAEAIPPPPTPKEAFKIATQNSFDYSAIVFVGITSLLAEGTDTHAQLGKGIEGFGRYYWRGFVDKAASPSISSA